MYKLKVTAERIDGYCNQPILVGDSFILDAIHYEPHVSETVSLREFKKGSRGLDPEQKRLRYALSCAEQLRQLWIAERRG